MGRQMQRFHCLLQGEAMGDQSRKINLAAENQLYILVL